MDVGVAWEVRQDIEDALREHCAAPENAADFVGSPAVTFREVVDPLKVYLGIGFTYNFPGAALQRHEHRTLQYCAVRTA